MAYRIPEPVMPSVLRGRDPYSIGSMRTPLSSPHAGLYAGAKHEERNMPRCAAPERALAQLAASRRIVPGKPCARSGSIAEPPWARFDPPHPRPKR